MRENKFSVDITHYLIKQDDKEDYGMIGSKHWVYDTYDEAFKSLEMEVDKYQKDETVTDIKASTKETIKVYRQRDNKWILTLICLNHVE